MSPVECHLMLDLIATCRSGWRFYRSYADTTDDYEFKTLLLETAEVHRQISEQLSKHSLSEDTPFGTSPTAGVSRVSYHSEAAPKPFHQDIITAQRNEKTALDILKNSIKRNESSLFMREVAHHLASLQISQDKLKRIDVSH